LRLAEEKPRLSFNAGNQCKNCNAGQLQVLLVAISCPGRAGLHVVRLRAEARASGGHEQSRVGFNHEITRQLQAWGSGDASTLEQLMPIVYNELHWLADRYMAAEQPGQTLQTTALVHEVYLRLTDASNIEWQDRAHFYAIPCPPDAAHSRRFCPFAKNIKNEAAIPRI